MMRGLQMGRYCPGNSLLHRSDPRTKIAVLLIFVLITYRVESYPALLLLMLATLLQASRAGKQVRDTLRGLKPIFWLALFAFIFNPLFIEGTPLGEHGVFRYLSREGIDLSVKMVMRLFLLVGGASLLTGTTSPLTLTDGLERLLKPLRHFGLPAQEIAMMVTLALRFVPVLAEEAERVIWAQSSRSGGFPSGNPVQRARGCLPLLVPLFAGAVRKGEELATAMETRCYRGAFGRSRMRPLAFSGADIAVVGAMFALATLLMLVERVCV